MGFSDEIQYIASTLEEFSQQTKIKTKNQMINIWPIKTFIFSENILSFRQILWLTWYSTFMLIKNSKINQHHGAVCSLNSWPRNSPHFMNLEGLCLCSQEWTLDIKMQIYLLLCVVMCSMLKVWHYNLNRKVHLELWSNYLGPSFTETKMVPEKSKYEDRKTSM